MAKTAPNPFLYLHGIDEFNLEVYRQRLSEMFATVNDERTEEGFVDGSDEAFYRQPLKDEIDPGSGDTVPVYRELRVSIVEMDGIFAPVLRCKMVHSNAISDYVVHEVIPEGVKFDVSDFDHVLDVIERWQDFTSRAFTAEGHIGQAYLDEVSRKETKAFRVLNALVHAYIEFSEDEKFTVCVNQRKPYAASEFHQIVGGHRFDFLSPETKAAIDKLFPPVVKLHFSASESIMHYWLGPLDEDDCIVEPETLPKDAALSHILKGLADLPLPHLLEEPELVED
ncbi:hypothetical protein [Erythrobacter aureus]|uniref:Uncharacterized protein n=1 Tax=Erythrobacter aureus TaxID=2182384 RepID=A0A345YIW9_9SPHN|nr:hypothetical protein [Erythrobacter aureus]AXK43871.1 hypothetical protein DVR09_15565 [Erythrobacter aureus]